MAVKSNSSDLPFLSKPQSELLNIKLPTSLPEIACFFSTEIVPWRLGQV
jgi:hypothetical protein